MNFEYKVVPAPTRGRRAKGVKTPADRFARALEDTINEFAAEGWDYLRTDTLPSEERQGLTGRTTVYQNMLVFPSEPAPEQTPATPEVVVKEVPETGALLPPGGFAALALIGVGLAALIAGRSRRRSTKTA